MALTCRDETLAGSEAVVVAVEAMKLTADLYDDADRWRHVREVSKHPSDINSLGLQDIVADFM
jgi:hypothetical protein